MEWDCCVNFIVKKLSLVLSDLVEQVDSIFSFEYDTVILSESCLLISYYLCVYK